MRKTTYEIRTDANNFRTLHVFSEPICSTHGDMNEQFIRRDVEWGLHGDD